MSNHILNGPRTILTPEDDLYPAGLEDVNPVPKQLYVIGDPSILELASIAIIGPRKSTPYGNDCARRFARLAVDEGLIVVSGGAIGTDTIAVNAAIEAGARCIIVQAGGLDNPYPLSNIGQFQRVIDGGGAIVSEQSWDTAPKPYLFLARNRITAALANWVLATECGLPSGTFSTCDTALAIGRKLLVVPGPITSPQSAGCNELMMSGAVPIINDQVFLEQISCSEAYTQTEFPF